tara:strand:+ start:176 stop:865 length:690 start_codon:yes stop_codon:yes gene_type:complete
MDHQRDAELANGALTILSDAWSFVTGGLPSATLSDAIQKYGRNQAKVAAEELLRELSKGEVSECYIVDRDESLAVIVRYMAAARDGAARRNLRLLSQSIAGLASRHILSPDRFGKYADILTRLTRDQTFVAGRYLALLKRVADNEYKIEDSLDSAYLLMRMDPYPTLKKELVPSQFGTAHELDAVLLQLGGLGLIASGVVEADMLYKPTFSLLELSKLVDFESASDADG